MPSRSSRTILAVIALTAGLAPVAGGRAEPAAPAQKAKPMPADAQPADGPQPDTKNPALAGRVPDEELPKTEAEWRKRLTPQQYRVTRQKATDRAFTGEYTDAETAGTPCLAG